MLHISTIDGHQRMSTRDLLQAISAAVQKGETDFLISASGQHDIGGPLWSPDGAEIRIRVANPGQRVGAMCLPGTQVIVEGAAPADAGWLNSGGEITIHGDAGDTAGHCAAGGKIYIGGRAGARSGSLMKHDPLYDAPELWVLKHTGSFSFEFMSGGIAVVCGHDCLDMPSVLGERPGVGMVGGTIYFRGETPALPEDVMASALDDRDIEFLENGLERFLASLRKPALKKDLSIWRQWRKLIPANNQKRKKHSAIREFRMHNWIEGGIFADIIDDDLQTIPLVPTASDRLRAPVWQNPQACLDCRLCLANCPRSAIKRRQHDDRPIYSASDRQCIGCGICQAVCPAAVWKMEQEIWKSCSLK